MKDKPLATLLTQYHRQLANVFDLLSNELKETTNLECRIVKKKGKWIGEGKEPTGWYISSFDLYDPNYEWLDIKGNPIILDKLANFLDNLKEDIEGLK